MQQSVHTRHKHTKVKPHGYANIHACIQYCCPTMKKNTLEHTFIVTFYLRGPQRVRPKKPRREMTQLKTACFNNFIHYKESRYKKTTDTLLWQVHT